MASVDFVYILIFFIYGLAFFSMGLTTMMEAFRSPTLREAQILRPLAVFGLVHGIHEWLEMIIIIMSAFEVSLPGYWSLARIGMLVFSFATLIGYGIQVLSKPERLGSKDFVVGSVMLVIYGIALIAIGAFPSTAHNEWVIPAEFIARYLLATPGALVASMALRYQSNEFISNDRKQLSQNLRSASIGFGLYGVTQFFGPIVIIVAEKFVSTVPLSNLLRYSIPSIRAALALIITYSLIRMTQALEIERRNALQKAQEERLEALEEVQVEMQRRNELRKALLRRTVELQEEERARVSRELHDETAQILTGFNANLAALRNKVPHQDGAGTLMNRLGDLSNQMSDSIHKLVQDLRPAELDELGIHTALKKLVDNAEKNLGLDIRYEYNRYCERFDPLVETVIYRVTQEAITNIARYSGQNLALVSLVARKDTIQIMISDKGKGFNPETNKKNGFGLIGLEERVKSLGGRFEVISHPGKGTKVSATFAVKEPCEEEGQKE